MPQKCRKNNFFNGEKMAENHAIIELPEGFTRNQSNVGSAIATARTKMTALELKTFYQVSTLIHLDDSDFYEYSITVEKFARALGIGQTNREQIIKLCRRIVRQVFEIQDDNHWVAYPIFAKLDYNSKTQIITIMFNQVFRPFLLELKQFTKIQQVKYITSFSSKYAIRFYALIKDYRKMAQRDFELESLFQMFELPKSYNYTRFCQKVLAPAIREINEKSDVWVSEPEIIEKKGKKITKIRLHFGNKSDKMADDFVRSIMARFDKEKSFNVFWRCPFLSDGENVADVHRITRINTNNNEYFQLFCDGILENSVLGTANRDDFLASISNGISRALNAMYEKERAEKKNLLFWQDEQNKKVIFAELFKRFQQK